MPKTGCRPPMKNLERQKMFDEAQTGIKHDVSLSTNAKALKFVSLAPSAVYRDVWYF